MKCVCPEPLAPSAQMGKCGDGGVGGWKSSERKIVDASHQSLIWICCGIGARFGQFPANFFLLRLQLNSIDHENAFITIKRTQPTIKVKEFRAWDQRENSLDRKMKWFYLAQLHPLTAHGSWSATRMKCMTRNRMHTTRTHRTAKQTIRGRMKHLCRERKCARAHSIIPNHFQRQTVRRIQNLSMKISIFTHFWCDLRRVIYSVWIQRSGIVNQRRRTQWRRNANTFMHELTWV